MNLRQESKVAQVRSSTKACEKMWDKLLNFLELKNADDRLHQTIELKYVEATLKRLEYLSYAAIVAFVNYGIVSHQFIRVFRPEITLWDNLWPRLAFNALPLIFLGKLTKLTRVPPSMRLYLWCAGFCGVFDAAAAVYVWPIALSGRPEIMLYVGAANATVFGIFALTTAPSPRMAPKLFLIQVFALWVPLLSVAYFAGNTLIFNTVANDTVSLALVTLLMGIFLSKPLRKVIAVEMKNQSEASKFLGPVISRAVFEGREEGLLRQKRRGFFLSIDIRGSTEACKVDMEAWIRLRTAYFHEVSIIVKSNGGYIHKTVGDHHLISFAIMDDLEDLSEISGLEHEINQAEERRLHYWSHKAMAAAEQVAVTFHRLSDKEFPGYNMRIGLGLDKGLVERGVQGTGLTQELDVTGNAVNCATRLEEYTKVIQSKAAPSSSLLVMSPFASDYLDSFSGLKKVSAIEHPVRNFPGIKWVLLKEFARKSEVSTLDKKAA